MSKFKVDIKGIDTNNLKVLTNDEMVKLFKEKKDGYRDALINGNLKLVLSIIGKFRYKNMDLNDLFDAGCIGLIKAVDNFDLSFGVMFSTYAVPQILGEVRRVVRMNTSLRITRSMRDLACKILKFKEEYTSEFGIEPTNKIISKELKIDEYTIFRALNSTYEPLSIDAKPNEETGLSLADEIPCDALDLSTNLALKNAISKIKPKEREVLIRRYVYGETQNEIADTLNVSQAQISRIESTALKNARKLMEWI